MASAMKCNGPTCGARVFQSPKYYQHAGMVDAAGTIVQVGVVVRISRPPVAALHVALG